ncbi:MAG: 50S ribosome-binding GTPase [Myxococcota bacterium]|nr:50S ribosome-binding GTPase [Myxococcota bacterium]
MIGRLRAAARAFAAERRLPHDPHLEFLGRAFDAEHLKLAEVLGLSDEELDAAHLHHRVAMHLRRTGSSALRRRFAPRSYTSIVREIGRNMQPPIVPHQGANSTEYTRELEQRIARRYQDAGWHSDSDSGGREQKLPRFDADLVRCLHAIAYIAQLRVRINARAVIGFVGNPSSGKDAALRSVLGLDTGNIDPTAGSTSEVEIYAIPDSNEQLFAVNTPGLGDVRDEISDRARKVLRLIDIYVYVLNAEGGMRAGELEDFERCRSSGRPVVLVLNKIDLLRPDDVPRYIEDLRNRIPEDTQVLPCAFDPLVPLAGALGLEEALIQAVRDALARELGLEADRRRLGAAWDTSIDALRTPPPPPTTAHPLDRVALQGPARRRRPQVHERTPYGTPGDLLERRAFEPRRVVRWILIMVATGMTLLVLALVGLFFLVRMLFGLFVEQVESVTDHLDQVQQQGMVFERPQPESGLLLAPGRGPEPPTAPLM